MIYVIATIEIVEGRREAFVKAFLANVPNVLAEQGCIEYQPTTDLATEIKAQPAVRDSVVTIVEKWESLDALNAHLVAPHMISYRETVKDLVKGASLQILEPAASYQ
ncbi:MAG: antibiotic biosynthesis monooxygenase [Planctomycetaceae bacterium]|nr:antibiotic biosynthesis monooxygenase [Planctomycetales bacterium]MCB9924704.1 antibiotic biosynthesis monooxygenase [Planctomycetaceae bacterium]